MFLAAAIPLAAALGAEPKLPAARSDAAGAPAVALDTTGGDAWTFSKRITGRVRHGACDEVRVESRTTSRRAVVRNDRFAVEFPLPAGESVLRAVCGRNGRAIARSAVQPWQERLPDVPKAWIRERIDATSVHLDAGASAPAAGAFAPLARFEWRAAAGDPAPLRLTDGTPLSAGAATASRAIDIAAPGVDGDYGVTLRVIDALGRSDESTRLFRVRDGKPSAVDPAGHFPDWAQGAIVYGAALPLDGPHPLQAVARRLPAIAALGASVLWLSPITGAPPGDFGYAVSDALHVRPDFGTESDLRELVRRAHALGLRVILDMVVNHLGDQHPYARDLRRNGERSAYRDWFEHDAHGAPVHYFDWTHLDNLDYDDPEVQHYMIEVFARWLREDGVDGFRVDASWAVSERAPEFWPRWRAELERIDPDLLLIAEGSARDPEFLAQGFDVSYDWTERLGEWAWSGAFDGGARTPDLARLRAALAGTDRPGRVLRFLNDNDTGARFVTRHGEAETRLAAIMLLTLPGLPVIYDGDETGAEYEPYGGRPIDRQERGDLRSLYERLGRLRRSVPALRSDALRLIPTDHEADVLAYVRPAPPGTPQHPVLVVINWSGADLDVKLASDAAVLALAGGGAAMDVLDGRAVRLDGEMRELRVRAHEALVLRAPASPRRD
jgi:cyclomaltodextrinase / maltogenic alpha-amylase / neopullulanase